jgi:hypothetical protein
LEMISPRKSNTLVRNLGLLAVLVLFISGCSIFSQNKKNASGRQMPEQQPEETPTYYDFGDVPVPPELKLVTQSSFVYRTSGFSAGVLVLKGPIEIGSLIVFFENNMAKDNWQMISTFKSSRTLLLFQKENRWCVINITDNKYNTDVEIWVAPTTNPTASGLRK